LEREKNDKSIINYIPWIFILSFILLIKYIYIIKNINIFNYNLKYKNIKNIKKKRQKLYRNFQLYIIIKK
jgi:hypothetical protein